MTVATASQLEVGTLAEERSYGPITRTDIVRYAGAAGDFNPIHHDEPYARTAGFPTVFSIGMYQAGLLAGYATDWLGAETVRRFQVRFKDQVWPDDVLTCRGEVIDLRAQGTVTEVEVRLTATRHTGSIALEARATFCLPSAAPDPAVSSPRPDLG